MMLLKVICLLILSLSVPFGAASKAETCANPDCEGVLTVITEEELKTYVRAVASLSIGLFVC